MAGITPNSSREIELYCVSRNGRKIHFCDPECYAINCSRIGVKAKWSASMANYYKRNDADITPEGLLARQHRILAILEPKPEDEDSSED